MNTRLEIIMERGTERTMSLEPTRYLWMATVTAILWAGNVVAHPSDKTILPGPTISDAYTAVWAERRGDAHLASTGLLADFLALNVQREFEGFQLIDFETTVGLPDRRYAGVWHEAPESAIGFAEAAHLSVDVPLSDIGDVVATEAAQDYKLADLELYALDGVPMFAAIFHPSTAEQAYVFALDAASLVAFNNGFGATDFRLIDVEMYSESGALLYAAIWRQQTVSPSILVAEALWTDLIDTDVDHPTKYHLTDLEVAKISSPDTGHQWFFSGLWRRSLPTETHVLVQATWEELEAKHEWLMANPLPAPHRGWLPVDIEILWHVDGAMKSSLTVVHDGPMVPPPGQ